MAVLACLKCTGSIDARRGVHTNLATAVSNDSGKAALLAPFARVDRVVAMVS